MEEEEEEEMQQKLAFWDIDEKSGFSSATDEPVSLTCGTGAGVFAAGKEDDAGSGAGGFTSGGGGWGWGGPVGPLRVDGSWKLLGGAPPVCQYGEGPLLLVLVLPEWCSTDCSCFWWSCCNCCICCKCCSCKLEKLDDAVIDGAPYPPNPAVAAAAAAGGGWGPLNWWGRGPKCGGGWGAPP